MKTLVAVLSALACGTVLAATPEQELRSTFDRFVAAQNAHDLHAVGELLAESPTFLWITKGNAIWGRAAALERFGALYQGTWHLDPEPSGFRVVFANASTAQIYVPVTFTIGPRDQPAPPVRFLLNQVLTKSGDAWRIVSILPIPVPPTTP